MVNLEHIYQYLRSTDGVNQMQRSLAALAVDYVQVDERSKTDVINFVHALSAQINFYDLTNSPNGNWHPFFTFPDTGSALVAKAATTAALPAVIYRNGDGGAGATLTSLANGALPPQDGIAMADGDLLLVWQQPVPFQNGVYTVTQGNNSAPFVLTRTPGADKAKAFTSQIIETEQGLLHGRRFFNQQTNNPAIGTSAIIYARNGLSRNDWPPHLALFMAFLQLYSIAQQDMNKLTGRHLRYYYENVLQLRRRPAQPDQVHVVFELAKNAQPVLLRGGTLLDAGKLPDGKTPRHYALDNEVVVSQAVVQALKSSFTDVNNDGKAIVFKADDATQVKSDKGTTWRPFGSAQLKKSPAIRTMTETRLGFAIASPVLLMAEGERTITLTLDLQSAVPIASNQRLSSAFEIAVSGKKGWIVPLSFSADLKPANPPVPQKLEITATIPLTEESVVAYDEALHGTGYHTQWPVLRCLVKPEAYELERLGAFTVRNVSVEVTAKGVKNLVLQNDETIQPADKPVLPFGSQPAISNNFYIGSAEVFSKSLQSLSIYLEWKDLPGNFRDYYSGYDNPNITYVRFLTDVYLLAGRSWDTLVFFDQTLFNASSQDTVKTMMITEENLAVRMQGSGFRRKPGLGNIDKYDNQTTQGFIKLVLKDPTQAALGNLPSYAPVEAFGHKAFPTIYTHKVIDLSQQVPNVVLPNPPYTPTLKSVSLDYTARESFLPSNPNGIEQFFLLDIFGSAEIGKDETARLLPIIPQQGALYIGLRNATPPQTLSLLFQIEKGDVPGAALLKKEDLAWSYLSGNRWQTLAAGDILEEATDSFQEPGIIRINIGSDATTGGTLMQDGLYWVRAMATQRSDGVGAVQEVAAQAARATLVSTLSNLELIPAGTITRLVTKLPAIKSVKQSYPSLNGLPLESDNGFFRRSSERLRHRNRAVVTWDLERLVLEAFPEVFKVKSLQHTDEKNTIAPGYIKLVLVPDMRYRQGSDPLQPRNNLAFLRKVETFLKENFLSPFVATRIHIANPEYETLLIDCKAAFLPGFDPGFYVVQLEEDIRRFLSPWAYEEGQDIIFGGKIYKSEVLAFVEGRPYVDYVVDFQLYHRYGGQGLPQGISCMTVGLDFIVSTPPSATIASNDGTIAGAAIGDNFIIGEPTEVAVATRPDAILVSNAVHRIAALQAAGFQCKGTSSIGVGQMIVGLDFIPVS